MKTNTKPVRPMTRNHAGALVNLATKPLELRRAVMTAMLWENTFYERGNSLAARIEQAASECSFAHVADIAREARNEMKLRHVPLFLIVCLLKSCREIGKPMGDLVFDVVQRPDELGELLAMYWKDQPGSSIPRQLRIGLARALKKFSEYELAKWDGNNAAVKLRDVLFLTHARPNGADERYTKLERQRERAGKIEFKLNLQEQLFKRIAENRLKPPDTWENELSAGADKRATFTRLLEEGKLGALALLRNLRGMTEAGVPGSVIRDGINKMRTDRVLPFRFLTAAKYAPQFEDVLETAMFRCLAGQPKLSGRTALLIDGSGSMKERISADSELTRHDAAAALAMLLRETAEECRVFSFNQTTVSVPARRGFGLKAALPRPSGGTTLGQAVRYVYANFPECERLIVITDEQSSDRPQRPRGLGYIINVATYEYGVGHGPWVTINGWSEAVIDYIRQLEQE